MKNTSIKQKVFSLWLLILSPIILLSITLYLTSVGLFGELPTFEELENPKSNLATEIISSDGVVLGKYFFENRSNVKYHELSPKLVDALISTEDIRFRDHSGIDIRALLRAVKGVMTGSNSGGASTITQQLAKMLFTEKPASGLQRVMQKFKEWIIAVRLERQYTKDEILTMYLNKFDFKKVSFGDSGLLGRGGMTTKIKAARDYLNKNNEVWILNGNQEGIIEKTIQKKPIGTKIYLA